MSRLFKLAAVLSVVPAVAFASPALATVQSSTEGGDIYRVKNVTKNTDFTDPVSADACNVLQYKVRIHNPGPTSALTNVTVQAGFPTAASTKNVSIITVRASNASPSNTSDTATVNLSSVQALNYVNGSTELLDANGSLIKTLPDGITQGGVSIGNVGVSINEKRFVQFKEKINCPTPEPKVEFACVGLDVVKVDRTRFDFTARATTKNATVKSFGFTTKDSKNKVVDSQTVNTSALSAIYHFNQSTAGTYSVSAVVNTDKGSTQATAVCTKQVTVEAEPTPPTPPTPPKTLSTTTELPNTGPGGVAAVFAGASVLGAAGHYAVRRFRHGL